MRPRAAALFYFGAILLAGMATGTMLALVLTKFLSGSLLAAMGEACGGIFQAGQGFLAASRFNYILAVVAASAFFSQGAFFLGGGTRLIRATGRHSKARIRDCIICPALPKLSHEPWAAHVMMLPGNGIDAQTVGILRPRILITTELVSALSAQELGAVMAHEEAHRTGRDNALVMAAKAVSLALFYLPGQKTALREMCLRLESAADQRAVRNAGGPLPVASALAKIVSLSRHRGTAAAVVSAASGAGLSDVVTRINMLIDPPSPGNRRRLPLLFAALSLVFSLVFASSAFAVTGADQRGALVCFTEHAQEAPASGVCETDHPLH